MPVERRTLLDQIASGRYEEALGIGRNANVRERHRAFIVISGRWRPDDEVARALNRAKAAIFARASIAPPAQTIWKADDYHAELYRKHGDDLMLARAGAPAVFAFRKAIEHGGGLDDYFSLGRAFLTADHPWAAVGPLHLATVRRGSTHDRYWLGRALFQSGRPAEAVHEFAAVIERDDSVEHRLWLIRALAASHRQVQAIQMLRGSLRLHPGHAAYTYWLGATLLDCGRSRRALRLIGVAARASDARSWFGRCRALWQLDDQIRIDHPFGQRVRRVWRRTMAIAAVLLASRRRAG